MIYDYVLQCDSLGTVFDLDLELLCNEEANIYFAGGQTAEETAEHIQNRASILISANVLTVFSCASFRTFSYRLP